MKRDIEIYVVLQRQKHDGEESAGEDYNPAVENAPYFDPEWAKKPASENDFLRALQIMLMVNPNELFQLLPTTN